MDTLEGLVPLEIAQGIHLNKAGSQGCIGICWRIINQIYEASGNILGWAATQLWNLVREVVMRLIANWDLAWRNKTSGEFVQKVGNLIETLVREPWPSGFKGPSSVIDIATFTEKETKQVLIIGNPTLVFEYEKSRDSVETIFK